MRYRSATSSASCGAEASIGPCRSSGSIFPLSADGATGRGIGVVDRTIRCSQHQSVKAILNEHAGEGFVGDDIPLAGSCRIGECHWLQFLPMTPPAPASQEISSKLAKFCARSQRTATSSAYTAALMLNRLPPAPSPQPSSRLGFVDRGRRNARPPESRASAHLPSLCRNASVWPRRNRG